MIFENINSPPSRKATEDKGGKNERGHGFDWCRKSALGLDLSLQRT